MNQRQTLHSRATSDLGQGCAGARGLAV